MSSPLPAGLEAGGQRLWRALMAADESLREGPNGMREIALSACRTKDRLDRLDETLQTQPLVLRDRKGRAVINPAVVEARLQAQALKQLIAALRLPDQTTGRRPQYRGARGVYVPSGMSRG